MADNTRRHPYVGGNYSDNTKERILQFALDDAYESIRQGTDFFKDEGFLRQLARASYEIKGEEFTNQLLDGLYDQRQAWLREQSESARKKGYELKDRKVRKRERTSSFEEARQAFSRTKLVLMNEIKELAGKHAKGALGRQYLDEATVHKPAGALGPLLSPVAREPQRLLAFYGDRRSAPYKAAAPPDVQSYLDRINSGGGETLLNTTLKDGTLKVQGGKLWSHLVAPHTYGPYNANFSVNTQQHLEAFTSFAKKMDNKTNRFFAMDIENFGDSVTGEWFHVNEISIQGFTRDASGNYVEAPRQTFNALMGPSNALGNEMLSEIENLKRNPHLWALLPEYKQRSLVDAMRYSTSGQTLAGGVSVNSAVLDPSNLVHSNVLDANNLFDPSGKRLNHELLVKDFQNYSVHMENGIRNLVSHNANTAQSMTELNAFIQKNNRFFFTTHNGAKFDMPALQHFASNLGVDFTAPKHHMDWYGVLQSTFHDSEAMHRLIANGPIQPFVNGPMTLQELRRSVGIDVDGQAHNARADVDMRGLGGVILGMFDKVKSAVEEGKIGKSVQGYLQRNSVLEWSDDPIKVGQTLFATRGVGNYSGKQSDFQVEYDENGVARVLDPGFNSNVLDAESFYTVKGIHNLSEKGKDVFALELFDEEKGKGVFVTREGQDARYQISEFVQKNFQAFNLATDEERSMISSVVEQDQGRRRYGMLFSLDQSATKGYSALQRALNNAELIMSARRAGVDVEQHWDLISRGLTFGREKDYTTGFRSKWQPATGSSRGDFVFNQAEADQFKAILPRLESEYDFLRQATSEVDKAFAGEMAGAAGSKSAEKLVLQKKSLAISNIMMGLDEEIGKPRESRERLPYEQRIAYFGDKSINFHTMESATEGISRYIYEGWKDNGEKQGQIAKERLFGLVTEMQTAGLFDTADDMSGAGFVNSFTSHFLDQNTPLQDGVKSLAHGLWESNSILQETIETDSIGRREVEKAISLETAQKLINGGIDDTRALYNASGRGKNVPLFAVGEINDILNTLDQVDSITGLVPRNRQALERTLTAVEQGFFTSTGSKMPYSTAVTMNLDNSIAYVNVFKDSMHDSVLDSLNKGIVPNNVLQVPVPLVRNGTISYGNQTLNAFNRLLAGGQTISSAEEIAMMHERSVGSAVSNYVRGNLEDAKSTVHRTVQRTVENLAAVRGDLDRNDWSVQNAITDTDKQKRIDVTPAVVHDLVKEGQLLTENQLGPRGGIVQRAHVKPSGLTNGALNQIVSMDDLTQEGQDLVRRYTNTYVQDNKIDAGYSTTKGDRVADNQLARGNAADYYFMGRYGEVSKRDNPIQARNAVHLSPEVRANIHSLDIDTLPDDAMRTAYELKEIDAKLGDERLGVNVKTAFMSDQEIRRRMEAGAIDLRDNGANDWMAREGYVTGYDINTREPIFDPVKMPTTYEQQIMMRKELADQFVVEQTKEHRVNDGGRFVINPALQNADGSFKTVDPGDLLGWRRTNGMIESVRHDKAVAAEILSYNETEGMRVGWKEQAHKFTSEFEKGTLGGGRDRYSANVFEFLTGDSGVGVIMDSNVLKHEDFNAVLKMQLSRVLEELQNDPNKLTPEVSNSLYNDFGITASATDEGIRFIDNNADRVVGGIAPSIQGAALRNMLSEFGLDELPNGVLVGYAELRAMNIPEYNKVVGNNRTVHKDVDAIDGVKYSFRELDSLRKKGLDGLADSYSDFMVSDAKERGALREFNGIKKSLQAIIEDPASWEPNAEALTFTLDDFEAMPEESRVSANYKNTLLDTDYVERLISDRGLDPASVDGIYLRLPETLTPDYQYKIGEHTVNRVHIPIRELSTDGSQVQKTQLQQINEGIVRRAQELRDAQSAAATTNGLPDYTRVNTAFGALNDQLNKFGEQILKDTTSSKGVGLQQVLRAAMPNSATGKTKVLSPNTTMDLAEDVTYISPEEAKRLQGGVYDYIQQNGELIVPSERYPNFHDYAVRMTKLRINENVATGEHHISSLQAAAQEADSDGDSSHIVAYDTVGRQAELEKAYNEQVLGDRRRIENWEEKFGSFEEALSQVEDPEQRQGLYRQLLTEEHSKYFSQTGEHAWDIDSLTSENGGNFIGYAQGTQEQLVAKSGKAYVGVAHDLGRQYQEWANNVDNASGRADLKLFGQGLVQKIISAKHTSIDAAGRELITDDIILRDLDKMDADPMSVRTGSLQLIQALQQGEYDRALQIDQAFLGGVFTSDYRMETALEALRGVEVSDPALRFGSSTGIRPEVWVEGEGDRMVKASGYQVAIDALDGNGPVTNPAINAYTAAAGISSPETAEYYNNASELLESDALPPAPHVPTPLTPPETIGPNFLQRGLAHVQDFFSTTGGKFALAGGALATAGIAIGFSRAADLAPEDIASNDENIQSAHNQAMNVPRQQKSTYVEENGEGLNIRVTGQSNRNISPNDIGNMAGQALNSSGIQAQINVRAQDDRSSIDDAWVQNQFAQLLQNGYTNG